MSAIQLTAEQLAELLAGIARAQNALVDAVDRANGGWRNTHLLPVLNVAANVRQAEPRLIDLPSRVLLRSQGRGAIDIAAIAADLVRLTTAGGEVAAVAPAPAVGAPGEELDFSAKG